MPHPEVGSYTDIAVDTEEVFSVAPSSEMFHFKFVNHGNSLLQKMNLLREQDCFCDVALQIHNFTFQGHKVVLAASSPFLRDQFLLNDSREVSISVLQSSEIGRQLLLSCYTGILEFPVKELVNYLTAASALQMGHVVERCAQAVSQYLDPTLADIKGVMTFNEVQPCSPSSDGDEFQETVDGFDMDSEDRAYVVKNVPPSIIPSKCKRFFSKSLASSIETSGSNTQDYSTDDSVDQEVVSGDIYMLAAHEIEFQGLASSSPVSEDSQQHDQVQSALISKLMSENFIREHDAILQKPYYCRKCSKVFQHLENYISHVKEHKLYLCLRCGKTFSQKSNLTRHIRVHTGMKPFECPLCKKAFSQKATLQDHVNLHTGIKPHKCNYCAVHFAHKPGLRRHLKDVHRKSSLENTCEKVEALIVDSD
ncbi:zinc finger and BTB domain-containing protein 26-like [Acipenser oxyrinchus oxyrinchus]|uniref:Zinc finger and BTB domain-containing protein 26-like n=1 Tax=Acipenser oxyrinchus oxyrinchus TaxID=40147 RepID=A0AAD8CT26_ACIOX|nr:zinc finger and BTB domain-containing protein 26-like [Acipenser oxyrinchus oxyrinchus]